MRLRQGEHQLSLPSSLGGSQVSVKIDRPFQVVTLRVVGNQVFAGGPALHVETKAAGQAVASLKQP
ncbi:hypothetical protein D3C79_1011560 [compost metagenome]